MSLEILLLCSLIFVFIVSFCGLLQKIKQSYQRERIIAERMARRHTRRSESTTEAYLNSTFVEDFESINSPGIFPSAPPPYTNLDAPPKYEDIIKTEASYIITVDPVASNEPNRVNSLPPPPYSPPPYTIST